MSKKQKGRAAVVSASPAPKPPTPASPTSSQPTTQPVDSDESASGFDLIRFTKRVKITLGVFVGLFLLFVLFKWHYVSLPIWNTILPDGSPTTRGLVTGTPKQIRMDDYAVAAPWILSNATNGFAQENEAIGGLNSSLILLPTHHVVTLFRPGHWGFMFLDTERGYSWIYDINPLILLVGSFLFFLLITRNQYGLSLVGALTLLLSSGTVRWSFIPSAMIGYCCAAFVTVVYLLHEKKPARVALFALLLVWLVCSFALILYPPYQLPMAYLFGFALIGYLANNYRSIFPLKAVVVKLASLAVAAGLAGVVLWLFLGDVQETLKAVTGTVYPGQRSESGGTGFVANWYSEYYSWFFDDQKVPKGWLNICELSHYLNFAPVIIPLMILLFVLNRKIDWMLAATALFVVLMWIWVEVGFPSGLAKASLMSMVPTRRAQIPMGVGGIILLISYLGAIRDSALRDLYRRVPVWGNALALTAIVGFVVYTAYVNVNDSDGLIKPYQTFVPVVFFALMNALLLFTIPVRYRVTIFCAGLLIFLLPNLKANPLSKGLSPITDNVFYKTVRQLVEQDPQARWLVNGSQYLTYMVTATGAKQITGVKYLPDRKHVLKVLDPEMKRDSAYNRYAHVTNQSYINGRDSVILFNQFEDAYVIAMDPCSPRMKQLNVKYQVFDHQPQPVEVRCMKSVATLGSLTIYQANP
ncbi:DUF7657 domain-containing protein [Spirosoma fluviale]|uniref:Dolichyl-phosphate-mannose-protein mannosyltransferase n=1 Tax=Spirosoma fluviale TaxID=1597977 RepID=A0A286GNH0_9BACT|nr:hypothetical protein [Spirosoma fluviale]SOD97093.1 hypothetical protein SAMN06269250_5661 [Spirosoma fluviale]